MAAPEGRIEPAEVLAAVARIDAARSHGWSVLSNERPDFDTVLEYARQAGQHPTGSGEKGEPTCTHCGRPFSPDHDVAAGPTVRHPFTPSTNQPRTGGHVTTWRQGSMVPHNVYEQRGDEPDASPWPHGDRPVAMFTEPADAALAVHAVNHYGNCTSEPMRSTP